MNQHKEIYHPVGSFYTVAKFLHGAQAFAPKDKDWVVYCPEDTYVAYMSSLFSKGFIYSDEAYDMENFISMRKGEINLIVTPDPQFFEKFILAAMLCKYLNVLGKQQRIIVHDVIMKGTFNNLPPLLSPDFGGPEI